MPSFLGGKLHSAFGQPAFFLGGNRMAIVAFEKEVSFKSLSLFRKKRLLDNTEVLNLGKYVISINGKKKVQRVFSCLFGGRRKV